MVSRVLGVCQDFQRGRSQVQLVQLCRGHISSVPRDRVHQRSLPWINPSSLKCCFQRITNDLACNSNLSFIHSTTILQATATRKKNSCDKQRSCNKPYTVQPKQDFNQNQPCNQQPAFDQNQTFTQCQSFNKDSHFQYRMDHSGSSMGASIRTSTNLICGIIGNILWYNIGLL